MIDMNRYSNLSIVYVIVLFELKHDKTNKMTCAPSERSAWASALSHQSNPCLHEDTLGP